MSELNNREERKLQTFGIFEPRVCLNPQVDNPSILEVYQYLKKIGFVETRWQFIFRGQLASLVLPFNDNRNEIHVRFYEDRIFAEFEVGRSSFLHFLGPFKNANDYILSRLEGHVSVGSFHKCKKMMAEERLYKQEYALEPWLYELDIETLNSQSLNSVTCHEHKPTRLECVATRLLGWQSINYIFGTVLSLGLLNSHGIGSAAFTAVLCGFTSLLLPRVGHP